MIGTSPRRPQRFLAAVPVLLGLAACSGGGGGGGTPNGAPVLVAAAFEGSLTTPVAGDDLILTFSETVALVANTLLTDADFELSGSATLGTVTANPVLAAANRVVVQLGAGVNFVPGSTTITLRTRSGSTGNDAVRDTAGVAGVAGQAVTIGTSDNTNPVLDNLTIAGVDDALNGTGPAGGRLQVPRSGWTIDLEHTDNGAIVPGETFITASVAVSTGGGPIATGSNLLPVLVLESSTANATTFSVPAGVTFPDGPVTLTAVVTDNSGLGSAAVTFPATVRAFNAARQPFETSPNASQIWFLDFSRDIESFVVAGGGGGVDIVNGANSRSDFEDILRILGLGRDTPIPNVQSGLDSNQVVIARFQAALLAELEALYDGANVDFTLTQPGGPTFGSQPFVPYAALGYSRISICGASDLQGVLGVAIFDPNNTEQNDNTVVDFGGTRLGVFLHTIVDSGFQASPGSLFRQTYGQFATGLGGTAIGATNDDQRLTGSLNDARRVAIDTAIADLARFTAIVTAHECGHSMGLVVNGAMPVGLYGNDTVNFPNSSDGHISTPQLFPSGAINVMSPVLSYDGAINPASAFNSLNIAYLREQVTYGN